MPCRKIPTAGDGASIVSVSAAVSQVQAVAQVAMSDGVKEQEQELVSCWLVAGRTERVATPFELREHRRLDELTASGCAQPSVTAATRDEERSIVPRADKATGVQTTVLRERTWLVFARSPASVLPTSCAYSTGEVNKPVNPHRSDSSGSLG